MWPCGQSTVSSWARRIFRRVATRFWCIHYRAGHQCFDLHLSVDFCGHEWIGSIWRAPHRLCQQASIPVHRSFNFFSCHAWISIYGCKVRSHTLVCTFQGSEPLILCNVWVDSMVIRFEQVCISQQGLLFRSLLLCISIDTLSVSRGAELEKNRRGGQHFIVYRWYSRKFGENLEVISDYGIFFLDAAVSRTHNVAQPLGVSMDSFAKLCFARSKLSISIMS